jgi:leucyl-tRNA---protein transferase
VNALATSCPYPAIAPPTQVALMVVPPHPCPYLPDRMATLRAFFARDMDGEVYHSFMDASFRRSGRVIYQPICQGCRECLPLRVPVERFQPSRSQRRCWARNQDLSIDLGDMRATDEKYELYRKYQTVRHANADGEDRRNFEEFLYVSPIRTIEFNYRDAAGRLVAVGICDLCAKSLSSVYFYYDPEPKRRSLGTFGALAELQWARQRAISYYYFGYWISGSRPMNYKAMFRPHELLEPDGNWRLVESVDGKAGGPADTNR